MITQTQILTLVDQLQEKIYQTYLEKVPDEDVPAAVCECTRGCIWSISIDDFCVWYQETHDEEDLTLDACWEQYVQQLKKYSIPVLGPVPKPREHLDVMNNSATDIELNETGVRQFKTKVLSCSRCRRDHTELQFKEFQNPIPSDWPNGQDWNYWALCPVTNEPILLQVQHHEDGTKDVQHEPI